MSKPATHYKGIPLAKCPHNREMTDAELLRAEADAFKMLQADGWKPKKRLEGDEWKDGE